MKLLDNCHYDQRRFSTQLNIYDETFKEIIND